MSSPQSENAFKERIHNLVRSTIPDIVPADLDNIVENLFLAADNQINAAILWQKRFVIHPLECRLRDQLRDQNTTTETTPVQNPSVSKKRKVGFGNGTFVKPGGGITAPPVNALPPSNFIDNIELLFNEPEGLEKIKQFTFYPSGSNSELFNCGVRYTIEEFIKIAKSKLSSLDAAILGWKIMPYECRSLLRETLKA